MPTVSVVTPAFNAGRTLDRVFATMAGQRRGDWEHIVVDDGSQDDTAARVLRRAADDPRVRLVAQPHAGASAARNRGLAAARGDWILFLDADDTVRGDFLDRMLARSARAPEAEVVACGYRRCDRDGRVVARYHPPQTEDVAATCERRPPTAIHAGLFRRALLDRLGGFDERLATREDWDLWQRLVRAGAKVAVEPRLLADYWNSAGSLTRDSSGMVRDAATVLERQHLPDDDATPDGDDPAARNAALLENLLWAGALAVAEGGHGLEVAGEVRLPLRLPDEADLTGQLLDGLMIGSGGGFADLAARASDLLPRLAAFLARVAVVADEPGFDRALLRAVEAEMVRAGRIGREMRVGATHAVALGPRALLRGVVPRAGCEIVLLKAPLLRPRSLFLFPAPALGPLTGGDVRALVARRLRDEVVGRLLEHPRLFRPVARSLRAIAAGRRIVRRLLGRGDDAAAPNAVAESLEDPGEATPGGGTGEAWDSFFATEDPWNYGSAYEQLKYDRTLGLIPADAAIGRALELACAEGMFTQRLAPRVGRLRATDISQVALNRARARCEAGGIANVDYATLDFFNGPIGEGWDLIVASEVLYYMEGAGALDGFVGKVEAGLRPGGLFLHAHAYQVTDDPGRTGFDWGDPFGVATISHTFRASPRLERVRAITTDLYLIELYRRIDGATADGDGALAELPLATDLEVAVASSVVWNGAVRTRQQVEEEERTYDLPVLMYHRIAAEGPAGLAEWRTSAERFEHQLRFLRRRGYRSVSIDEWEDARRRSGSLRGRPILITFDDAYRDFHETAFPILERNGFSAHMFVVTGKVGATSDWDAAFGLPAPLMDWDAIRDLHRRGATFGSHLETHTAADRLPIADLFGEAVRSRETLEDRLGVPIRTLAPPYGATNPRVEETCRAAGYTRLFEAGGGMARIAGPPLSTPRIDVAGHDDIATFAGKLGRMDEPPQPEDRP